MIYILSTIYHIILYKPMLEYCVSVCVSLNDHNYLCTIHINCT